MFLATPATLGSALLACSQNDA